MAANTVALARKRKRDVAHQQHYDVRGSKLSTRKYSTRKDFPPGSWNRTYRLVPKDSKSAYRKSLAEFKVSDGFRNQSSGLFKSTSPNGMGKSVAGSKPWDVTVASTIIQPVKNSFDSLWSKKVDEAINLLRKELAYVRLKNRVNGSNNSVEDHIEAAKLLKQQGIWLNTDKPLGDIPGVQVGDRFQSRAELRIIGLHCQFRKGIDYVDSLNGRPLATSVVDSGRYTKTDYTRFPEVLIYSGEGGNPSVQTAAKYKDQKLARGNLALRNSMIMRKPVRFVRKVWIPGESSSSYEFVYEGLYMVVDYKLVKGKQGKKVYEFILERKKQSAKFQANRATGRKAI